MKVYVLAIRTEQEVLKTLSLILNLLAAFLLQLISTKDLKCFNGCICSIV